MKNQLYRFICVLLVLVVLASTGVSQTKTTLSETDRARFDALRRSGLDALYDLDYEKARKDFSEIARLFPDHPAGPQLLAARVWIKTLYETRRLQSSLYSSESFYTQGDDKVDAKVVAEFLLKLSASKAFLAKRVVEVKISVV